MSTKFDAEPFLGAECMSENHTTDQSDIWWVVLGCLLSPCFRLLILTVSVVRCIVICLLITGVTLVMLFCIISFV